MDFDDDPADRRGLPASDPLAPGDWAGFGRAARDEQFYSSHQARVTGIFRRNVPSQEVPDLVQETFRRLFSAKGDYASLIDAPAAYLAAAARSILKNRKRSGVRGQLHAHHSFEDHHVAGPDPHKVLEQRDMLRRLDEAIAGLDASTRDVFLLHRFEDLRYSEIARIKGISVKRVEKHIAKAMKVLRKARDTQP